MRANLPFAWGSFRLSLLAIPGGLFALATPMLGQKERRVTQLADGVYAIEHQDTGDGFNSGNTTVIIGERQVFVVDAGFLPSAAREDIAQIRRWTDKPVSFLLNTHFHNDHNLANRAYTDAFPGLTIIAHIETKRDMDRFGPGSKSREERANLSLQRMLSTGKTPDGRPLTAAERTEVKNALARRGPGLAELENLRFQSATLTFEHDFTVDLGDREVQVRFLGRGNTAGDAVVYLPREETVVTGDLVVYPIPYFYDGYPAEWVQTLQKLAQLDAKTIVPGHGPILHDQTYIFQLRDLLKSAVDQINAELTRVGPAMFRSVDEVKGAVDLAPFLPRFAGTDKDLTAAFDDMVAHLIQVAFKEASLR